MLFGGYTKNNIIVKRTILSIVVSLSLLFLASCDKNKEVKQFATDFAAAVQSGNKSEITKMYPGAAAADSLVFAFDVEKSQIETQENGNIKIVLGEGKDVTIVENENGEGFKVKESHGVFAYSADNLDFAKKTGQWKDGITDEELAKRMNDKDFEKSLIEKFEKDFSKRFSIVHKVPDSNFDASERQSIYIVKNNSSSQIDGSDYEISIPFCKESYMFDPNPKRWNETREGKTISPNGSVSYVEYIVIERGDFSRSGPVFDGHAIVLKLKGKALFNKYFSSTGNEYEEYLKAKH